MTISIEKHSNVTYSAKSWGKFRIFQWLRLFHAFELFPFRLRAVTVCFSSFFLRALISTLKRRRGKQKGQKYEQNVYALNQDCFKIVLDLVDLEQS